MVLGNLNRSLIKDSKNQLFPKKVFLARKQNKRTYNQEEVIDVLSKKGYEAIYFENMSVQEQLIHMQAAEYIVGPTGATWANLLFSNAKAGLIWVSSCVDESTTYSKVAEATNTDLRYMTFPTKAKSWAEFMKLNKPYKLDTRELLKEIDDIESASVIN